MWPKFGAVFRNSLSVHVWRGSGHRSGLARTTDADFNALTTVAELSIRLDTHIFPSNPRRRYLVTALSADANSRLSLATSRLKREMPLSGT